MKGQAKLVFLKDREIKFTEDSKAIKYNLWLVCDNEGITGDCYIPSSVSLKEGDKISVSAQYNAHNYFKFKYLKED